MEIILVLIGLPALFALPVGLVMLLFKKRRKLGLQVSAISFLALVVFGVAMPQVEQWNATSEGYLNVADKKLAEEAGYASAEEWNRDRTKVLAEQREKRQADLAAAEQRAAEEARQRAEAEKATQAEQAQKEADRQASEQAAKDAHKTKNVAKVSQMADSIAETLRQHYSVEPRPLGDNPTFCQPHGFCTLYAGDFKIDVYGAGIAEIETTTQAPQSRYRELCSAVLSALSGSNLDFAAEVMEGAFYNAGQSGRVKLEVTGTEVDIKPDGIGLMACSFFKYGS
ncbi:MAG: hypothetical protein ROO70_19060 [Labrenzia sp.]